MSRTHPSEVDDDGWVPLDPESEDAAWYDDPGLAGEAWGPAVKLGSALRVQATRGVRAAVVELRPGLYLVAEVPGPAARPEFGVLPLLAPLMISAARHVLKPRQEPAEVPALPAPPVELGWADRSVVAEVVGCERCDRCGRRRP
jgi:hypothetical protein